MIDWPFFPTPSQNKKTGIKPKSQPLFLRSSKHKNKGNPTPQPPKPSNTPIAQNHDPSGLLIPHCFKHDSGPQFEPVPTGGILLLTSSLARSCPNAALASSYGKPLVNTCPMFKVPASSESSAETSWAFSQPIEMVSAQSCVRSLPCTRSLSCCRKTDEGLSLAKERTG
jgi:hypothetical protein